MSAQMRSYWIGRDSHPSVLTNPKNTSLWLRPGGRVASLEVRVHPFEPTTAVIRWHGHAGPWEPKRLLKTVKTRGSKRRLARQKAVNAFPVFTLF